MYQAIISDKKAWVHPCQVQEQTKVQELEHICIGHPKENISLGTHPHRHKRKWTGICTGYMSVVNWSLVLLLVLINQILQNSLTDGHITGPKSDSTCHQNKNMRKRLKLQRCY